MYITYEDYTALYDPIDEKLFSRLVFDACRYVDRHTTGIDGVKKLKEAFPVEEDAILSVKHCVANVVNFLFQIQEAESSASAGRGYQKTENGLQGKVVASVSAGNESISFTTGTGNTLLDSAVSDLAVRNKLISQTIKDYLAGVSDAHGVNLLYMGVYPCV